MSQGQKGKKGQKPSKSRRGRRSKKGAAPEPAPPFPGFQIGPGERRGLLGLSILVVVFGLLLITGVRIFLPFLSPLLLALIFTTASWPVFDWVLGRVGRERRGVAASLTCGALVLLLGLPLVWLTFALTKEALEARGVVEPAVTRLTRPETLEHLRGGEWELLLEDLKQCILALKSTPDELPELPELLEDAALPATGTSSAGAEAGPASDPSTTTPGAIAGLDEAEVDRVLRFAGWVTRLAGRVLQGALGLAVQVGLLLFIMFYFYRDGPSLLESFRRALPLDQSYQQHVVNTFRRVSRSLMRGTLATSLAQALIAFPGFLAVGLPAATFWSAMVAVTSLVPVVGTALITVPLSLAYVLSDQLWWEGAFLLALAGLISASDNLLRPLFLEEGLSLHPLWILLSILGGVQCFGALGLVVGPMVLVFLGTFLALVRRETGNADESTEALDAS